MVAGRLGAGQIRDGGHGGDAPRLTDIAPTSPAIASQPTDADTPVDVSKPSLRTRAVRGSTWTFLGYGGVQVVRLGGNLTLAALLFPEAFGLMAIVSVFLQTLQVFSDVGIAPSVVQSKRGDDPVFLNTAWTIQVGRGVILWLISCLLAYPVAGFYNQPLLMWLLPISGLTAVIAGVNSTKLFTAHRHLAIGRITAIEFFAAVIGITASIVFALIYRSVWALVVGGLVTAASKALFSHIALPGVTNRLAFNRESSRELIGFGKWIFLNTLFGALAMHIDRLFLGKLLTMETLGVYAIARNLAMMPDQLIKRMSTMIIFPVMAQTERDNPGQLGNRLLGPRRKVLLGSAVLLAPVACFSDVAVGFMYDDRYAMAAWMTPILLLGLWPAVLAGTLDRALLAIGKPAGLLCGTLARLVFVTSGLLIGYALFGVAGAVLAIALSESIRYAGVLIALHKHGFTAIRQDFFATLLLLTLVSAIVVGRWKMGVPILLPPLTA